MKCISIISVMQQEHAFLATAPFDLYELHLFKLLAGEGNFTRAAAKAGLTQSAMTRQIAGMENALGVRLFDRTTRSVTLTAAGELLLDRARADIEAGLIDDRRFARRHRFVAKNAERRRVAVHRLCLPAGFSLQVSTRGASVQVNLVQEPSRRLLELLDSRELDVAVICSGPRLPRGVEVAHRFKDEFTLVVPSSITISTKARLKVKDLGRALGNPRWLMIDRKSTTGALLHSWLEDHGFEGESAMEINNFDLIVNMVALGLGVSIVPHRALPLYLQRRRLQKTCAATRFSRELAVVTRKTNYPKPHVEQFVKSILF